MFYNFRIARPEEVYHLLTNVYGGYDCDSADCRTWYICETKLHTPIAFVGLLFNDPQCIIEYIGTAKQNRRRGAALALLSFLRQELSGILVATVPTANEAAVQLFEKAGYDQIKKGPLATYIRGKH